MTAKNFGKVPNYISLNKERNEIERKEIMQLQGKFMDEERRSK